MHYTPARGTQYATEKESKPQTAATSIHETNTHTSLDVHDHDHTQILLHTALVATTTHEKKLAQTGFLCPHHP